MERRLIVLLPLATLMILIFAILLIFATQTLVTIRCREIFVYIYMCVYVCMGQVRSSHWVPQNFDLKIGVPSWVFKKMTPHLRYSSLVWHELCQLRDFGFKFHLPVLNVGNFRDHSSNNHPSNPQQPIQQPYVKRTIPTFMMATIYSLQVMVIFLVIWIPDFTRRF